MLIQWLEPWESLDNPKVFEEELYRELGKDHVLYGKEAIALGGRCDRDDFLFEIKQADEPCFAVVHLTCSQNAETNPLWPTTRIYKDIDTWIKECMMEDHLYY